MASSSREELPVIIPKEDIALLRALNAQKVISTATFRRFLNDPDSVWFNEDVLSIARSTAATMRSAQERAVQWSTIVQVTKEKADLDEVLRAYKEAPPNHPSRKETTRALITAYFAVGDIKSAIAVVEASEHDNRMEGTDKLRLWISFAELMETNEYDDRIRALISLQRDEEQCMQWAKFASFTADPRDLEQVERRIVALSSDANIGRRDWTRVFYARALLAFNRAVEAREVISAIDDPEHRALGFAAIAQSTKEAPDATEALTTIMRTAGRRKLVPVKTIIEVVEACIVSGIKDDLRQWAETCGHPDACLIYSSLAASSDDEDAKRALRKALAHESVITDVHDHVNVARLELTRALALHGDLLNAKRVMFRIRNQLEQCRAALIIYEEESVRNHDATH